MEAKEGTVTAFAVAGGRAADGTRHGTLGRRRADVCEHPSVGRFLLVANYFGGSVAVLPMLDDGRLGPRPS